MKHEAWYTLETLNDYVVMLCDFFIYHTILHNACPLGRQCVLPPSWISTNDVWIMVNVLYVLGIKHLSCRNDRCVIVREGQFLDLKQCNFRSFHTLFLKFILTLYVNNSKHIFLSLFHHEMINNYIYIYCLSRYKISGRY